MILVFEGTGELGGAQIDTYLIKKYSPENITLFIPEISSFAKKLDENNISYQLYRQLKWRSLSIRIGRYYVLNPVNCLYNALIGMYNLSVVIHIIRKVAPESIVTNGIMMHFIGGIASRLTRVPITMRLMDIVRQNLFMGYGKSMFEMFCRWSKAHVIVPSKAVAAMNFSSAFSYRNVSVIYNATDVSLGVNHHSITVFNDITVVGCFSRLVSWKGQKELISCCLDLFEEGIEFRLDLVGSPMFGDNEYFNQLINMAKSSVFSDKIRFLGFRTDIFELMNDCDLIIVPSILPDPCPRVMIEAMSLSKPLIGSNLGGIPEVIENGVNGEIFDVGDLNELKNAIKKLVQNPKLREQYGKKGLEFSKTKYPVEEYVRKHLSAFQK